MKGGGGERLGKDAGCWTCGFQNSTVMVPVPSQRSWRQGQGILIRLVLVTALITCDELGPMVLVP